MSGDLHNACEKLRTELKAIKYARLPTEKEFLEENPVIFLQILHYTLVDYSPLISEYLIQQDFELYSKNDMRFMECVFKLMIKDLNMKPGININQFFSPAYAESKVNLCVSLTHRIRTLKDELEPNKKKSKPKNIGEQRYPTKLPGSKNIEDKENFDENIPIQKDKPNKKKISVIQDIFTQGLKEEDDIDQIPKFNIMPHPEENIHKEVLMPVMAMPDREETPEPKLVKKSSKPQESTNNQMKDVLKMMLDINTTISTMSKKFEEFQGNVESWMNNTNARMILLENNYKMLRSSQSMNAKNVSIEPTD